MFNTVPWTCFLPNLIWMGQNTHFHFIRVLFFATLFFSWIWFSCFWTDREPHSALQSFKQIFRRRRGTYYWLVFFRIPCWFRRDTCCLVFFSLSLPDCGMTTVEVSVSAREIFDGRVNLVGLAFALALTPMSSSHNSAWFCCTHQTCDNRCYCETRWNHVTDLDFVLEVKPRYW